MKEITQIENYTVEIWRRAYQRTLNLTLRPEGHLRVTCNRRVSQKEIGRFIRDSREFILKRTLHFESLRKKYPPKQYLSGERFLFFGQALPLEVVWTWSPRVRVQIAEDRFEMLAPLTSTWTDRAKAMRMFFRKQAKLHLPERMTDLACAMDLIPMALSIRGQTSRWGSCTSDGKISLNMKLLACPEKAIDYVVIHELAHIKHMNHSKEFWSLVANYDSAWKESKRWLTEHEYEIGVQFEKEERKPNL